ncbi:Oligopeptide transport ATP-binding protein OppF [Koleobacter methoxysyntrophicus]|uniref:Oligopeptide transport ATP-binding protein OppF n=1 Tax=Koleobacter methoxysyntrophicus TaxID=2751313 RepID=A0A8A0RMI1_9FIRM|nr:ABC transporter ATP-binding protein [Koleobacter methoxysyntrophicus]QSQ08820.1 Oligopeptide transport ATP-binding protein OppF [Koleobacter methoxysyntrophicus]
MFDKVLLTVNKITKIYKAPDNSPVRAVDDVCFFVKEGEVLTLVGGSGSGKTTIALCILGLIRPDSGEIYYRSKDIFAIPKKQLGREISFIFQNPYEYLNPYSTVVNVLSETLNVVGISLDPEEKRKRINETMKMVGLRPMESYADRYVYQLSGGQKQKLAVASALVLKPKLVIADNPVSMLDISIRNEVLNIIKAINRDQGISFLFITNDLRIASHISDRIAVIVNGRMVETGTPEQIIKNPSHPFTKSLTSSILGIDPNSRILY